MSRVNLAYQMAEQTGIHEAITSTMFKPIAVTDSGVVLAWSGATTIAQLSAARVAVGNPNCVEGCMVILTRAGVSIPVVLNTSTTSVTWTFIST